MESVVHIGIDLAWGPRNRTGIAAVDDGGALIASATLRSDDEIVAWLERHAPRTGVVAIDAPLIVANPEGSRPCEQQIQRAFGRFDAGGYPSNTSNPQFDPPRAFTLSRRLGLGIDPSDARREHVAIEVYPHPAMVGLFQLGRTIKYKRKQQGFDLQLSETRRLLDLMESISALRLRESVDWATIRRVVDGAEGPGVLGKVEDEIDGIFCAHLAWLWAQRSPALQVYGDVEQGYIVAPPSPTWAPTPRLVPAPPRDEPPVDESMTVAAPTREDARMTPPEPHVFVTRGDLLHVACDTWMLPTDRFGGVTEDWLAVPGVADRFVDSLSAEFRSGDVLAAPMVRWKAAPTPILTAVPDAGVQSEGGMRHVEDAVRAFIEVGARVARERRFPNRRPIPLLAMPTFATRQGGGGDVRGEVLRTIMRAAGEAAVEHGVDVVIVVRDAATFAHAQAERRGRASGREAWPAVDDAQWTHVERLARLASTGRLVPFMGAGVSVSANGPEWRELIHRLAPLAGLHVGEEDALNGLSMLDQASVLEQRFVEQSPEHGRERFRRAIADQVRLERYGLAPALLATLAPPQAITLNYDQLYEQATADIGGSPLAVIADRSIEAGADRWLLKLHGSVDRPESIALTRDDYLGYRTTRNALSSIVKANLLTHHLLFVGFGFTDDHFHEIVHDVRLAVEPGGEPFATALKLDVTALDDVLLRGTATPVSMAVPGVDAWPPTWAGRQVEIFLDALVAYATDSHDYLLDDDFESALTEDDRALKEALIAFRASVPETAMRSPAWAQVQRALERLGDQSPRSR